MIRLSQEWTPLLQHFREHHQDARNRVCHRVGIPMIVASLPLAATLVGLPLAVPLFSVGWGILFVGHAIEGKKPAFVARVSQTGDELHNWRSHLTGVVWWLQEVGAPVVETPPPVPE